MFRTAVLLLLLACGLPSRAADLPGGDALWLTTPPRLPAVQLYFFWSKRCPHCLTARPFIESLPQRQPWIQVNSLEIYDNLGNRAHFEEMARIIGVQPSSVPTFMWCGRHFTGYGSDRETGRFLVEALTDCYREQFGRAPEGAEADAPSRPVAEPTRPLELPWFGRFDPANYSLPALAVILGGLDAFNPCAFFVLLFLLSLLVNTGSRGRMLLVGGVFVTVSGLVYFAFMAAWLNLFQMLDSIQTITLIAGLIALLIGGINIKDYFLFRQGVSLSLTDRQKSHLFARMRGLLAADRLPTLLAGTLALALAANTYELLCTVGLPMVFTRLLTLEPLPPLHYYGYLALYNLVYVLPLAVIVGLFVTTMGRRKLKESEGRFLKLLSGTMMASLGSMLALAPEHLSNPLSAVLLIGLSLVVSALIHWTRRRFAPPPPRPPPAP